MLGRLLCTFRGHRWQLMVMEPLGLVRARCVTCRSTVSPLVAVFDTRKRA